MKNFKNSLLFNVSYFFLWISYFIFARFFFLLFYFEKTKELEFNTILKTFLYGIQLDTSFSAYLCIIPFLLIIFSTFINTAIIVKIIKWYSYLLLIFITLLLIIDASLYEAWGVRLDTTVLAYIDTPEVMIASVSTYQMISGILFWFITSYIFIIIFKKIINKNSKKISIKNWLQIPLLLLLTGALILPIRGGLQEIPVNQSNVYFSSKMFANHAAVNFIWNFSNTITHKTGNKNIYKFFDNETTKSIIHKTRDKLLLSTQILS